MLKVVATFTCGLAVATAVPLRTRRASCSAFTSHQACTDDAPDAMDCDWAPAEYFDYDPGNFICQPSTCKTITAKPNFPELCQANPDCKFDIQYYACYGKDSPPPCQVFWEEASCPTDRCEYYVTSDPDATYVSGTCLDSTEGMRCDKIQTKEGCTRDATLGCKWDSDITKCWPEGDVIPCDEYQFLAQSVCPDHCKWLAISATHGQCVNVEEKVPCAQFSKPEDCDGARCVWYQLTPDHEVGMCDPLGKEFDCNTLEGDYCEVTSMCEWTPGGSNGAPGSCTKCPSENCAAAPDDDAVFPPSPPGSVDDGKPCSEHVGDTVHDCPYARCSLAPLEGKGRTDDLCDQVGHGDVELVCSEKGCNDFYGDAPGCTGLAGCTLYSEPPICYAAGAAFPCQLGGRTADLCPSEFCDFVTEGTVGEDDDAAGGGRPPITFGACVQKGESIPCIELQGDKACGTAGAGRCKWDSTINYCVAADWDPDCSCFNGFGALDGSMCPVANGKCTYESGICHEKGVPLNCNDVHLEASCEFSGSCTWSDADRMCVACEASGCPALLPCNTYSEVKTCPRSHCEWNFGDGGALDPAAGGGTCGDPACNGIGVEPICTRSAGCDWTSTGGADGVCFPKGLDVPCDQYHTQTDCAGAVGVTGSSIGCNWDEPSHDCLERDEESPCMSFRQTDCPTDRCVLVDPRRPGLADDDAGDDRGGGGRPVIMMCETDPAKFDSTPAALTGKGDGTGNEDESKCTPLMFAALRGKLDEAHDECGVIHRGRRGREGVTPLGQPGPSQRPTTDLQLECLAYFLKKAPNPTTIQESCPCLWKYAGAVDPEITGWLKVPC